jgi:hypothetical protein
MDTHKLQQLLASLDMSRVNVVLCNKVVEPFLWYHVFKDELDCVCALDATAHALR